MLCLRYRLNGEGAVMGGMSDVRLQLLAKELETEQQAKVFNAPQGWGAGA